MPYEIRQQDNQYCVYRVGSDESLGCHDSADNAAQQIAAIEANEGKSITIHRQGTAVKALARGRVGGYLVVWGDADTKDLQGEYFTPQTDLALDWYDTRPALYHHGLDGSLKAAVIGRIDTLKADDTGLWAEAQLDLHKQYVEAVQKLVDKGVLNWSSGSLSHLAEVEEDGKIKFWPLVEGSLTPTPAEPRKTDIQTIKSAYQELGLDFQKLEHANKRQKPKEVIKPKEVHSRKAEDVKVDNPNMEKKMDEDENVMSDEMKATITKMIQEEVKAALAAAQSEAKAMDDEEEAQVEAAMVDEVMQEMMDEEENKSLSESKLRDLIADTVVAKFAPILTNVLNKRAEREAKLKAAARKATQEAAMKQDAKSKAGFGDESKDANKGASKAHDITVDELRAYSGLSAEEMSLGIKLALNRVPEWQRKGLKLRDFVDNEVVSEAYIKTMAHKAATSIVDWKPHIDQPSQNDFMAIKAIKFLKADELHATDISGQGAEWVELFYDTQLWRRVRENTELYNLMVNKGMRVKDIPTGVKGMNIKLETASGTVYTLQEAGSVDATGRPETVAALSQITTAEIEQDLATHIIAQGFTFQMQERSIIDVVSYLNEDMQTALEEAIEDVFINGDTVTTASTNINLIDGTPATGTQTPLYIAFDGIRKNALSAATYYIDNANAALAATDYEKVRALFPLRIRRRKQNILLLVDENIETATRRLAEAFTVGVAGEGNATFFTGDLSVLVGFDVYASSFLNLSNGDGKISATAGNNTQAQIYGVFCPYWQYGRQLNINIEEARYPLSQSSVFVATVNHLLKERSGYASVGMYDIAPVS